MGQTALILQVKVALRSEFCHRVLVKKLSRYPPCGGFSGYRFGAVFAKLKSRGMVAVWPGTARAIKTIRLVGRQQGFGTLDRNALLLQRPAYAAQGTPPTRWALVCLDFFIAHTDSGVF